MLRNRNLEEENLINAQIYDFNLNIFEEYFVFKRGCFCDTMRLRQIGLGNVMIRRLGISRVK